MGAQVVYSDAEGFLIIRVFKDAARLHQQLDTN